LPTVKKIVVAAAASRMKIPPGISQRRIPHLDSIKIPPHRRAVSPGTNQAFLKRAVEPFLRVRGAPSRKINYSVAWCSPRSEKAARKKLEERQSQKVRAGANGERPGYCTADNILANKVARKTWL